MKRGHVPIGEKMHRLTAIEDLGLRQTARERLRWLRCQCDCGNEVEVSMNNFKSGNTKSCGCLDLEVRQARARANAEKNKRYSFPNIIGGTYPGGTITGEGEPYAWKGREIQRAVVRCHCGEVYSPIVSSLVVGRVKSCGCLQRIAAAENIRKATTTHGMSGSPLHVLWQRMRARCNNPGSTQYQWYGARGIAVCPEWNDFAAFYKWATANGYGDGFELDRIDNDGPYSPENCRFISHAENVQNSTTAKLDPDKVRRIRALSDPNIKALARKYGVTEYCIWCVLKRKTWKNIA